MSVKTQLVMRTYLENLPIDATAILHERVSTAYYHPEQDETATDLLLCDFTELAEERLAEALSALSTSGHDELEVVEQLQERKRGAVWCGLRGRGGGGGEKSKVA